MINSRICKFCLPLLLTVLSVCGCAISNHSPQDLVLQRQVTKALSSASELTSHTVYVSVQDGVVVLHGNTESGYDRSMAARIAGKVEGVSRVYNRIFVLKRESDL